MADDLAPLDELLEDLVASIEPAARKRIAGKIATSLRNANAKRIRANVTPEGEPMVPRKGKPRRRRDAQGRSSRKLKVGAMFQRAAGPSYLRKTSSAEAANVGYFGALARVMGVHQFGLRDSVSREPGAPEVTYPARPLIGLSADDRERIFAQVMGRLDSSSTS